MSYLASHANKPAVLATEAGVPYAPSGGGASENNPFAEWLSLMVVVQMLCPTWPARDQPTHGEYWRL